MNAISRFPSPPADDFGDAYPFITPEWDEDDVVECQCGTRLLFDDAVQGENDLGRVYFCSECEPQPCLNRMAWEDSLRGDR